MSHNCLRSTSIRTSGTLRQASSLQVHWAFKLGTTADPRTIAISLVLDFESETHDRGIGYASETVSLAGISLCDRFD